MLATSSDDFYRNTCLGVTLVSLDDKGTAAVVDDEVFDDIDDDAGFAAVFGVFRIVDFFTSLSNGGIIKFSMLGIGCFCE